jgi:hypothetical protein
MTPKVPGTVDQFGHGFLLLLVSVQVECGLPHAPVAQRSWDSPMGARDQMNVNLSSCDRTAVIAKVIACGNEHWQVARRRRVSLLFDDVLQEDSR